MLQSHCASEYNLNARFAASARGGGAAMRWVGPAIAVSMSPFVVVRVFGLVVVGLLRYRGGWMTPVPTSKNSPQT